ncbi:MAG: DUF3048 domain-containing protein, partial [Lawsonibacter sp.]|nr:DUF3048 domain-containing protein [Lawsonibacter sp.]
MKLKQLIQRVPLFLLAAALCACGRSGNDTSSVSSSSMPDEPSISVLAPAEPEPEPEPVLPYVNPLTGVGCETDISQNRPIAIMLNNLKKALPQLGVSQADIIYEIPAEGGITRMLAVFQSVDGVGNIGSVRSARDYYVSLAYGHDAVFLHAGGSPQAYSAIKKWGVTALDCVNGPYEGTLFWRDPERKKNAGLEHSVLTSGDTIQSLLPTYKRVTLEHAAGYSYPMSFLADGSTASGQRADSVTIKFSTYKTGVFTYEPATGLYKIEEYGAPYVDGDSGDQVAVKNVLVLNTDISAVKGDEKGRLSVRTTGTGTGQFFCDGTVQEITWSKKDNASPITYAA